jgi:hypothetical protein
VSDSPNGFRNLAKLRGCTKEKGKKMKLKDITSGDTHLLRATKKAQWIVRRDRHYTTAISLDESRKFSVLSGTIGEIDFSSGRIFLFDETTQTFWETESA